MSSKRGLGSTECRPGEEREISESEREREREREKEKRRSSASKLVETNIYS